MQLLNQSKTPSKCSVRGCCNQTTNYFDGKKHKIYLCDECFATLGELAITRRTPKSPTNTIKRKMTQQQEELHV